MLPPLEARHGLLVRHRTAFASAPSCRRQHATPRRLQAVKPDSEISTKDWRAQKMSEAAHTFFDRVWSRGETDLMDGLLADSFAYKDMIWAAQRPIVGVKQFKQYVEGMRTAYPDLYYEITSIGVADPSHVFCYWNCHGTNLQPTVDEKGQPHKPTFHESHISGIDIITFTEDRSKIQEVVIYRQPTLEEREFLEEEALNQDRLTIKLERLHFDRGGRL